MAGARETVLLIAGVAASMGGCFDPDEECEPDSCASGVLRICRGRQNPTGSSATYERKYCASVDACRNDAEGGFCVVRAERDPRCDGVETFCDGDVFHFCRDGWVQSATRCAQCSPDGCEGWLTNGCDLPEDCAAGTDCINGRCTMACDCPDSEPCEPCRALYESPTRVGACVDGLCRIVERRRPW